MWQYLLTGFFNFTREYFLKVRYELIRGNGELFKVQRETGDIEIKQNLEGHNREYQLLIAAYDKGSTLTNWFIHYSKHIYLYLRNNSMPNWCNCTRQSDRPINAYFQETVLFGSYSRKHRVIFSIICVCTSRVTFGKEINLQHCKRKWFGRICVRFQYR